MNNNITTFQFPLTIGRDVNVRITDQNGDPWFIAKDVCDVLGLTTANLARDLDDDEQGVFQLMTPAIFSNPDLFSGNLRVIMQGDEPWFVAKDVCDALGLRTNNLRTVLDAEEVALMPNDYTVGISGKTPLIINESGLYSLIFKSRKPEAKRFKKWVTSEVLPSIRKHGGYLKGQEELPEGLVSNLHRTLQENALPALRYYDRLTEHDHYPGISKHKREASKQEAIIETAVKFDLPPSFVRQLVSYGVEEALRVR